MQIRRRCLHLLGSQAFAIFGCLVRDTSDHHFCRFDNAQRLLRISPSYSYDLIFLSLSLIYPAHDIRIQLIMGAYYDEIEIEDMAWDEEKRVYHYPCPCGDRFEISRKQLANYEDIATCPSCSLIIRVVYDPVCYLLVAESSSCLTLTPARF